MPRTVATGGEGKRYPLNMRTTKKTRESLEAAAEASGRSLAQEVEYRLERSFERADLLVDVLTVAYGPRLAGILLMVGDSMKRAGETGASFADMRTISDVASTWPSHPFAFDQAVQAADCILDALRPAGSIEAPDHLKKLLSDDGESFGERIGVTFANDRIAAACGDGTNPKYRQDGETYSALLGDDLVERLKEKRDAR